MYLAEGLQNKWAPVLDHEDMPKISDPYRRAVTAVILENQEVAMKEQGGGGLLTEAVPTNASAGALGSNFQDPVLISMIRRAMPNLIAYDICGVQPMTGPTGLIFAMRARYDNNSGTEAFVNEADERHSGQASTAAHAGEAGVQAAQGGTLAAPSNSTGMTTAEAEGLGLSSAVDTQGAPSGTAKEDFQQMAFTIEKVTVTAVSRALKGEYSMELAQDLKAVHGLDAETELANILSQEILAEINREVIRSIYYTAIHGAQHNTTNAGIFDLDTDSNGRWSVEKFKGLMFQIERDANAIAKTTRRGKGNILITSSDVASALSMAGVMDGANIDDTGSTMVGTLNGRYKVYVDPYFSSAAANFYVVGYKGSSAFDAGIFYCPYVPLQMVRAVGEHSFQPKIGFKTRYGIKANPFGDSAGTGALTQGTNSAGNYYYRLARVNNLM